MTRRRGFRRLFGRAPAAPVLDPPGYRLSPRAMPPPPPQVGPSAAMATPATPVTPVPATPLPATPTTPAPTTPATPKVRLVLADGTVSELPVDEDLEARAAYLVRSMLPPTPPPPPPSGQPVPPQG